MLLMNRLLEVPFVLLEVWSCWSTHLSSFMSSDIAAPAGR